MLVVKLYPWQKNQQKQQGEQAPQGLADAPTNTASAQDALVMELLRRRLVQLNPVQPPSPRPADDIPEWGKAYLADSVEPDVAAKPAGGSLPRAAQGQEAANTTQAKQRDAAQKPYSVTINGSNPQIAGERVREFDGFAQGGEPARHYYVIGRRPLDLSWKTLANWLYKEGPEPGPGEHRHLIGSNGKNFGTTPDGLFTEKAELYSQYVYADQKKYDAECIEEAKLRLDKRFEQSAYEKAVSWDLRDYSRDMAWYYNYNCQHYVDDVILEAEKVANERGISLLVQ